MRQYDVKILPLTEQEIEKKVLWYNDPEIRKYLHYTDSFNKNDSLNWLQRIKKSDTRKEYAVSYTHLDVYKRQQVLRSCSCCLH